MNYVFAVALLVLAGCERVEPALTSDDVAAKVAECKKLDLRSQAYTDRYTRDVVKVVCLPKREPFGARFGKLP